MSLVMSSSSRYLTFPVPNTEPRATGRIIDSFGCPGYAAIAFGLDVHVWLEAEKTGATDGA